MLKDKLECEKYYLCITIRYMIHKTINEKLAIHKFYIGKTVMSLKDCLSTSIREYEVIL